MTRFFETGMGGGLNVGLISYSSVPIRYTVGTATEIPVGFGLSMEIDTLYKRFNYSEKGSVISYGPEYGILSSATLTTGNAWEFPLLLKFRLPGRRARLYFDGGFNQRWVTNLHQWDNQTLRSVIGPPSASYRRIEKTDPSELRRRWFPGVSIGEGVEIRVGGLLWTPEIRYTRWTANANKGVALSLEGNQLEFLLGIGFAR